MDGRDRIKEGGQIVVVVDLPVDHSGYNKEDNSKAGSEVFERELSNHENIKQEESNHDTIDCNGSHLDS